MTAPVPFDDDLDDPRRIVQLIPYTGPGFHPDYMREGWPIAWALCADGAVRLVVFKHGSCRAEVSDEQDWWDWRV